MKKTYSIERSERLPPVTQMAPRRLGIVRVNDPVLLYSEKGALHKIRQAGEGLRTQRALTSF